MSGGRDGPYEGFFRQCDLVQIKTGTGMSFTTAWIPEKFAEVGRFLRLQNEDGTWEDHWKVREVHGRMDGQLVKAGGRAHRSFGPSLRDGGRVGGT